ncbi:MAG: hypothetical protein Sapg2KO_50360 [Saprospiraceae bacterium]
MSNSTNRKAQTNKQSFSRTTSIQQFSQTKLRFGPLFPLFASKIPDFDASFEQFIADLKKAAEK